MWKLVRKIVNKSLDKSVELYCDNRSSRERMMNFLTRKQSADVCLLSDREAFRFWYDWEQTERLSQSNGKKKKKRVIE